MHLEELGLDFRLNAANAARYLDYDKVAVLGQFQECSGNGLGGTSNSRARPAPPETSQGTGPPAGG